MGIGPGVKEQNHFLLKEMMLLRPKLNGQILKVLTSHRTGLLVITTRQYKAETIQKIWERSKFYLDSCGF